MIMILVTLYRSMSYSMLKINVLKEIRLIVTMYSLYGVQTCTIGIRIT